MMQASPVNNENTFDYFQSNRYSFAIYAEEITGYARPFVFCNHKPERRQKASNMKGKKKQT